MEPVLRKTGRRAFIKKMSRLDRNKRNIIVSAIWFAVFVSFTLLVKVADRAAIGPEGSVVGCAAVNGAFAKVVGVHMWLYKLTDVLGWLILLIAGGFAVLGVLQLIKGRSFKAVDADIYALGAFYVIVLIFYVFFEKVIVNYRPVIVDAAEGLEASYPSSHTVLALCVLGTAMLQFGRRLYSPKLKTAVIAVLAALMAVTAIGRLFSGVHWFTDIIGGVFLSGALIMSYATALGILDDRKEQK